MVSSFREMVSSLREKVSSLREMVSSLRGKVSSLWEMVWLPARAVFIPEQAGWIPEAGITLLREMVLLPEAAVWLPQGSGTSAGQAAGWVKLPSGGMAFFSRSWGFPMAHSPAKDAPVLSPHARPNVPENANGVSSFSPAVARHELPWVCDFKYQQPRSGLQPSCFAALWDETLAGFWHLLPNDPG